MIEIECLVRNLPDGRKIGYLGRLLVKALTDYHDRYTSGEIDLDTLVVDAFKNLILKDQFISDLKLFAYDKLAELAGINVEELDEKSVTEIRTLIIEYYNYSYEIDETKTDVLCNNTTCLANLHDFQERIRRKVINLIFNDQKRFLIHMPTGSGKTRTAGEIIIDFIRLSSTKALLSDNMKILWIAQSSELCFQAYETIKWLLDQKATQDVHLGHFYGSNNLSEEIIDKPAIIFCSIQKLLQNYSQPIWQDIKRDNYLVVIDEAHRSVADQWVKALNYFVEDSSVYLLGLTATPGSGNVIDDGGTHLLSTYYHNNKVAITDANYTELEKPIEYLVQRKFLAEIDRIDIDSDTTVPDAPTKTDSGEFKFSKKTLKELSASYSRNSSIVNIIQENFKENKKMLVFTCGVEHNRILEVLLGYHGIRAASVNANTENRNSLIKEFKTGELMVLLNFGVLTTGFDAPLTDVCIIARPISSVVMYSQMVGRILRGPNNKGNKRNTLYTIRDNLEHGDYDAMFNSFNKFYK